VGIKLILLLGNDQNRCSLFWFFTSSGIWNILGAASGLTVGKHQDDNDKYHDFLYLLKKFIYIQKHWGNICNVGGMV
jgi:hypothetical protein